MAVEPNRGSARNLESQCDKETLRESIEGLSGTLKLNYKTIRIKHNQKIADSEKREFEVYIIWVNVLSRRFPYNVRFLKHLGLVGKTNNNRFRVETCECNGAPVKFLHKVSGLIAMR